MGVRPKAKALLFARPAALFLLVWSFLVPKNPGAAAFLASLRISKRQFGNALPRHHSIAAATAAAATPHNHSTLLSTSNSPSSVTAVTRRDVVKRSGSEATSLIFLNRGDVSGSPEDRERHQQQHSLQCAKACAQACVRVPCQVMLSGGGVVTQTCTERRHVCISGNGPQNV